MKTKTLIISGLFITVIVALLAYNYVFNSKHRDIAKEEATVVLAANELYSYFENNETLATTNYLDKVIETKGEITAIEGNDVVLNDKIQISFNTKTPLNHQKGAALIIKGRCVGYDELIEVVKIDQATIIN